MLIFVMGCGENMNKFYRKPKPETMQQNREFYNKHYEKEIKWLKENLDKINKYNDFLSNMYVILITGNRKITPKMDSTIKKSILKCKQSPIYNEKLRNEQQSKLQPILKKIALVKKLAMEKNTHSVRFIENVESFVKEHHRITEKQMKSLNKIYKECGEDLFKGDENG